MSGSLVIPPDQQAQTNLLGLPAPSQAQAQQPVPQPSVAMQMALGDQWPDFWKQLQASNAADDQFKQQVTQGLHPQPFPSSLASPQQAAAMMAQQQAAAAPTQQAPAAPAVQAPRPSGAPLVWNGSAWVDPTQVQPAQPTPSIGQFAAPQPFVSPYSSASDRG
jgi:hypothetical protein